jgi:hypothetical protein
MKVPLGGGAQVQLAGMQQRPSNIVNDATSIYWTDNGGNVVMKLAK